MSYEQLQHIDGQSDNVQQRGLWIPLVFVWLLMLTTFSAAGRDGPSTAEDLDAIALIKVAVRILGLSVLGIMIVRAWHHPRRRVVAYYLLPLGLYVGWSVFSVFWSPLKSVSLGQVGGLLLQVMLAFMVALRCEELHDCSKILFHLSMPMLAFSTAILVIYMVSPEASGLVREIDILKGSPGFVYPTAAGATASLGIVILIAARLVWDWQWPRVLLAPALLIHGVLLVLAHSRTAIAVGAFIVLLSFLLFSRRFVASGVIAMVCIFMAGYIAIDPNLVLFDRTFEPVSEYARRGETDEQLKSITGRTSLWEVIWSEFNKSPLIGHGYFVTSEHGKLDVWENPDNKTAHNILLQVLASTGVIGMILFLWGLIRPLVACGKFLLSDLHVRKLGAFFGIIGVWYFGWGLFCESFMGPVAPESVVFFTLLGMAIGIFSSGCQTI